MRLVLTPILCAAAMAHAAVAAAGAPEIASRKPFDVRAAAPTLPPTATQQRALVDLAREHADLELRWNAAFGTPASILRRGTTLTGPADGAPADVARAWLDAHAGLFGWPPEMVAALQVAKVLAQPDGGPRVVLFKQAFGALTAASYGGSIVVGLDRDNRILLVRANALRAATLADVPATLTAADALAVVSGVPAPPVAGLLTGWTQFDRGTFAAPHFVRSVAFPSPQGTARPAYEVVFAARLDEGYRAVVDAATGEVLYKQQVVVFDGPEARVFLNYPGAPGQGGQHVIAPLAADPAASPAGWLSPVAGVQGVTTLGNNATTATNWGVFIAPDGAGQVRPVAPDGRFDFAFGDAWSTSNCGENALSQVVGGQPDLPTYALDAESATTNLFFHHNVFHDFFWKQGFVAEAGAMQADNFGAGGEPGDPLIGLVQAGAAAGDAPLWLGRDNAYMFPNADGLPSWSGMFLFEPLPVAEGGFLAPCVDGDFDAGVIYHEYTHAVTNRWAGAEFGNLDSYQGGSMGEAWSDFYALHYLHQEGIEAGDVLGTYVTGNTTRGIRNWPVGQVPVGFDDLGYDIVGEEVHADGEIWSGTLWKLRGALPPGYAAQIVSDGLPLAGPLPTMLDARDGILAADVARTGGAHQATIWSVFARAGMGASASAVDANDANPTPAFDHADPARNVTLVTQLLDARTRRPIANARVIVGDYEARVSPVARSSSDGVVRFPIQKGAYRLTIQAAGYGAQQIDVAPGTAGGVASVYKLHPNVASTAAGATVAAVSNASTLGAPQLALSDTEANTWRTDPDTDGPDGETLVVDLAGDKAVTVKSLQISAYVAGGNRFEALKDYQVHASNGGALWVPVTSGTFPTEAPRPVAPQLRSRRIDLGKGVLATHLKLVASPQDAVRERVQVAEFQAFTGGKVEVDAATLPPDPAVHDEGVVLGTTADGQLTLNLMTSGVCMSPPPTQGIDAWVSELPASYADGLHLITVRPESLLPADPRPDVDVYFLSADCQLVGSVASTASTESGTIPQGTRFVVSNLYTTAATRVVVDARPPQ